MQSGAEEVKEPVKIDRVEVVRVVGWLRGEGIAALRRSLPLVLAGVLLFAGLIVVRGRLVFQLDLTWEQASAAGLWIGCLFDVWAVLLVAIIAQAAAGLTPLPTTVGWAIAAFSVWLASVANVMHYEYFGAQLDLWVVRLHAADLLQIRGSVAQLGARWPTLLSLGLCVASITFVTLGDRLLVRWVPVERPRPSVWHRRARGVAQALVLALALSVVHRLPSWLDAGKGTSLVAANIVRVWSRQLFTSHRMYAGVGTAWAAELDGADSLDPDEPSRQLARYRASGRAADEPTSDLLRRQLDLDPEGTRATRARLGLPEDGPIHVIILFLESMRGFEVFHPDLGSELFPEMRRVLAEHAIEFTQAYSSSFTAGQTVRGQFSTLCSMLPNMTGAATYLAHNSVGVRCLQDLLAEAGYLTTWMNSFRDTYHGKRTFETLHGTDLFFDGDDFRARGVTETNGEWGLADEPFLLEVVALLEELAERGRPVFVNALTISAHHPYRHIPAGELSAKVIAATATSPYYQIFLTGLRYEGIAVSSFFERLFASSVADRTLVVLLADHSAGVMPPWDLDRAHQEEVRFRIPLALVTKNMPEPEIITYPVHQVDVAPTVARVVGLSGEVTWVGRDLFEGSGSPWVYSAGDAFSFRANDAACYSRGEPALQCVAIDGKDPLLDAELRSVPEDPTLTGFFRDTVRANMLAITLNLVR